MSVISGQSSLISDLVQMCLAGRDKFEPSADANLDENVKREIQSFNLPLQRIARDLNHRLRALGAPKPCHGPSKVPRLPTESAIAPWI